MHHLLDIPEELWLSHIFEYLLGPVGTYKKEVEDCNFQSSSLLDEIKSKHLFKFGIDNLKGLNSLSCVCRDLRKLLFTSAAAAASEEEEDSCELTTTTATDTFWLTISNLVELTNYFTRYEDYSDMNLTQGDLDQETAEENAKIQLTLENIEMGIQSDPADVASGCERADIVDTMKHWEEHTNMQRIVQQFKDRMSHMITSRSKYQKLRSKTGISTYELFIYKAHIMCFEMVPNFDSEKEIQSYYCFNNLEEHTLLSLELSTTSKQGEKGCYALLLDEFEQKDVEEVYNKYISLTVVIQWSFIENASFSNTLQYLSIVIRTQSEVTNEILENCHLPNLKLLSIAIEDEQTLMDHEVEKYKNLELAALKNINRATMPKLIHLSLKRFFNYEAISNIDLLDQLVCLEIVSGYGDGYNGEGVWNSGQVSTMLNRTYFKEGGAAGENDHCMQLLILFNAFGSYWRDGSLDEMEEFYNNCLQRSIAGSICHAAVKTFYQTCWE